MRGLEPPASRATIWRANQLRHTHHIAEKKEMARLEGLEPPTYCLEGSCSILLSYRRVWGAIQADRAGPRLNWSG